MTREEAIARIKDHIIVHKLNEPRAVFISEALNMAIKALSQEPCTDTVSIRKDIVKCRVGNIVAYNVEWLKKHWQMEMDIVCGVKPCDDAISREMALKECHDIVVDGERYRVVQEETLLGLPPITTMRDATPEEQKSVNDYIKNISTPTGVKFDDAPSVTQKSETVTEFSDRCRECGAKYGKYRKEAKRWKNKWLKSQKSGKWIKQTLSVKPFGEDTVLCDQCAFMTDIDSMYNYCPNCGAKMESEV